MANATHFIDLPSETIIEIISSLSGKDLATMSRISRRLHGIALPVLYKSPMLTATKNTTSAIPSLAVFLKTIVTLGYETLATSVRSLYIQWDTTPRTTPADITFLTPTATRFNFEYPLISQDAQLMLLLHLLPRLSILVIESPPNRRSSFTKFMEGKYSAQPLLPETLPVALQSLRDFFCPGGHRGPGISPRTLLTLLKLPRIESIDAFIVDESRFPYHALNAAAGSSPVTKLRFMNVDLQHKSLKRTLRVPRALTHFSYNIVVATRYFSLPDFISALQPLKNTLQYLHLDLSGVLGRDDSSGEPNPGPSENKSFHNWPALRNLSCSITTLVASDENATSLACVIPPGLREWEILLGSERDYQVVLLVEELMAVKTAVVPALERIVFGWGRNVFRQRVRVAAEAAGVRVANRFTRW